MQIKFELRSKTTRDNGTVSLRFIPAEGGPTGDLTLDNVPESEAADLSVPTTDELEGAERRNDSGEITKRGPKKPYQTVTVTIQAE